MLNLVKKFLCCCLVWLGLGARAQELQLLKNIPVSASLMEVDELGNAYVVRADNNLLRFDSKGDSTGFFRSVLNGPIGSLDVTNPLRILVYYPSFSKVLVLDRMLAPVAEIDLRRVGFSAPVVVASSADGNIWVYDPFGVRLRKFDPTGKVLQEGNDLRQELQTVPRPVYLVERERQLYLADTALGILVFDRFGSYVSTFPFTGQRQIQVFGTQIVYRVGDTLKTYDARTIADGKLPLPEAASGILSASLARDVLFVRRAKVLSVYRMRTDAADRARK
jgi:hypothetical protein